MHSLIMSHIFFKKDCTQVLKLMILTSKQSQGTFGVIQLPTRVERDRKVLSLIQVVISKGLVSKKKKNLGNLIIVVE